VFKKFLVVIVFMAAGSAVAQAQTAEEIIARNLKARGDEKKLRAVESQKITAEITTFRSRGRLRLHRGRLRLHHSVETGVAPVGIV